MEEGYYEVDLKGNLVFCNDSLCKIIGYSRDEFKKLTYKDYYQNPGEVLETYNRVYRTGKPEKTADWAIMTRSGKKKFIEISVSIHRNHEGQIIGFRGIGRDITERKQNEEALKASEERHREILASIEDGYFEVDLQGGWHSIFRGQVKGDNSDNILAHDIAVGTSHDIFLVGTMWGTVIFPNGDGGIEMTNDVGESAFVCQLIPISIPIQPSNVRVRRPFVKISPCVLPVLPGTDTSA